MSTSTTAPTAKAITVPGSRAAGATIQRNPSTTATIGFRPYTARQRSGTRLLEYATGVAKSQICTRNGMT